MALHAARKVSSGIPSRPSLSSTPSSLRSRPTDSHSITSDTYAPSMSDMPISDPPRGKSSLGVLGDIMKERSRSKLASTDSINDTMATFTTFTPNHSQLSFDTYMTPHYPDPTPDLLSGPLSGSRRQLRDARPAGP